jgi:NAD(P)-dependent dehydrogenase (short-subunit alcohol dehydrogenase family)
MTALAPAGARGERPLQGSVALVTGGGRGLGRLLAEVLAGAGAAVGVIGRSAEDLDETVRLIEAAGGVAAGARADVTDEPATAEAVGELHQRLGPADVLINNAGINGPIGPTWEVASDEWWRTLEVNLRGLLACTRLVLPEMLARRRGRIVNFTSNAGVFRWPGVSAYSVSKAAVVKLSENLAVEVRGTGVSVFSFHPGLLPIGLSQAVLAADVPPDSPEGRIARWARREFAEGRGADPGAAAELVVQLASGRGDSLSGRHIAVHDDLDLLLERLQDIHRDDLYTLRVRELQPAVPPASRRHTAEAVTPVPRRRRRSAADVSAPPPTPR